MVTHVSDTRFLSVAMAGNQLVLAEEYSDVA
jgi:hypothetical protein